MTITLHTSRGTLTGPSIPVIVATEWGPRARFALRHDGPRLGQIIERDETQPSAWHVLASVTSAETPDGQVHHSGGDWMEPHFGDPLAGVREASERLAAIRAEAEAVERDWRGAILAALADEQSAADVAAAAGITRQRVYQIRDGRR